MQEKNLGETGDDKRDRAEVGQNVFLAVRQQKQAQLALEQIVDGTRKPAEQNDKGNLPRGNPLRTDGQRKDGGAHQYRKQVEKPRPTVEMVCRRHDAVDGVAIPRGNRSVQRLHGRRSDARFQQGKVSKHLIDRGQQPVCFGAEAGQDQPGDEDAERDGHQLIEQPCYNVAESLLGFQTVHPAMPPFLSRRRRFTARRSTAERVFSTRIYHPGVSPNCPSRNASRQVSLRRIRRISAARSRCDSGQSGADRLESAC